MLNIPNYALVIVDLQVQFEAARCPATLRAICREVEIARAANLPIVVLELAPEDLVSAALELERHKGIQMPAPREDVLRPTTDARVMKALAGYDKYCVRWKYFSDGSANVIYALWDHQWPSENFRVVGVNTDKCVYKTVRGLRLQFRPYSRIELVLDACNTTCDFDWGIFTRLDVEMIDGASNQPEKIA
jgi:hypothetical protein